MDKEMEGVLARIRELMEDLQTEYNRHLDEPEVTERAKNLFHEVVVKMRSALDIIMHRIWQKYMPVGLSLKARAKTERAVYFPIADCPLKFREQLKTMKLDLTRDNSLLHDLLLKAQPFSTKRKDMSQLRDLANLGKHKRLAQQTKNSRSATRTKRADGAIIIVAPPVESNVRERMGAGIDPATVEQLNWVEFSVEGDEVRDPFFFLPFTFDRAREISIETSQPYLARHFAIALTFPPLHSFMAFLSAQRTLCATEPSPQVLSHRPPHPSRLFSFPNQPARL